MKFIPSTPRDQVPFLGGCLEEAIAVENEVRYIDAFVDSLPLEQLGFRLDFPENGRPAYHPAKLLKLFIYGYLNRIRSSRCLEKECRRNIEVMCGYWASSPRITTRLPTSARITRKPSPRSDLATSR
jgi:transposase